MEHLHKNGVVHCDLKPDNIVLKKMPEGDYKATLIDFNIAKMKKSNSSTNLVKSLQNEASSFCSFGVEMWSAPEVSISQSLSSPDMLLEQ